MAPALRSSMTDRRRPPQRPQVDSPALGCFLISFLSWFPLPLSVQFLPGGPSGLPGHSDEPPARVGPTSPASRTSVPPSPRSLQSPPHPHADSPDGHHTSGLGI